MTLRCMMLSSLCCASLLLLLEGRESWGAAVATPEGRPIRIAVADITPIFHSYGKRLYYQEKLEETGKALREREQLLQGQVKQLEEEIAGLSMGTPRRADLRKELAERQEELYRFGQKARQELDDAVRESTNLLYDDIDRVIRDYARQNGLDLVIKQQSFNRKQENAEAQSRSIGRRTVLFCAPDLDITAAITETLNREYAEQQKKDASVAPAKEEAKGGTKGRK